MKALILAAGYATRLYPLTKDRAKPLLPIAGRPIIDYIVDAIEAVDNIDRIFVVTNARFAPLFRRWAAGERRSCAVEILDDGTRSNDDRRGAIGDILFAIDEKRIDDDLLVIGGDNLSDVDLRDVVAFFRESGTTVVAYDVGDREAAKRYGIVAVDEQRRIVDFQEKPEEPPSTLASMAIYLYERDKLPLFGLYASGGNNMDQPGRFVQWLYRREPVFAYVHGGTWYDIGDLETLRRADGEYKAQRKLA